eukprot:NODE_8951_length_1457_cov_11.920301.p1 GENE.NODE_8951_length_1457_cov_11.920301~~NODE_8951_length_1457_cov_11.920301.p1  ORF type:complete len:415 (-),score=108.57 NODE_8951_length_1457_cov_11.920301:211-1350(-)
MAAACRGGAALLLGAHRASCSLATGWIIATTHCTRAGIVYGLPQTRPHLARAFAGGRTRADAGGDGGERRKPAAVDAGVCPGSGCGPTVQYFAARSHDAGASSAAFALAPRLHQFTLTDGEHLGNDSGAAAARFCAARLTRLVSHNFMERVRLGPQGPAATATGPIDAMADDEDFPATEADAVSRWGDALSAAFSHCDHWMAAERVSGGCSALFCAVARSGTYVASVGLGRAIVGTELPGGAVRHDKASRPHLADSSLEATRLGAAAARFSGATRLLGATEEKRKEALLIGLPDVTRHRHVDGARRFIVLGSPALWENCGPEALVQSAVNAYRVGRSPAAEIVAQSKGDGAAVVLVLPPNLGGALSPLPPHEELDAGTL